MTLIAMIRKLWHLRKERQKAAQCMATANHDLCAASKLAMSTVVLPPVDDMEPFRRLHQVDQDAFAVVRLIAERVAIGTEQYGQLDLANDTRNPAKEAMEEVADGLFYAGVALMKMRPK